MVIFPFSWHTWLSFHWFQIEVWKLPPALLPQGAVVCGAVVPWGCRDFTTQGIPRAQAETGQAAVGDHCTMLNQAPASSGRGNCRRILRPCTARLVQSLAPSPGDGKNHVSWAQGWGKSVQTYTKATIPIHKHLKALQKPVTLLLPSGRWVGDVKVFTNSLCHSFGDIWKWKHNSNKERESQGCTVYTGAGASNLKIGLALYSGCRLVQNRLRTRISGKVILKIGVKYM